MSSESKSAEVADKNAAAPLALELREVAVPSQRDPAQLVLEGVNWNVAVGDYWAVAGLLRSGKSDLMALAAGIMRPPQGVYRLFGQELDAGYEHDRLALRLRIGLVFDGGQLLHHLRLQENIALPLRYHLGQGQHQWEGRLRELMTLTGLEPWADSYPDQVTRNWQQRIGLARALAIKPEVLLLDNPLSGLDPKDAAWWHETLEGLAGGHPIMDGRPLTLVVTGDDIRPWRDRARQFAILKNRAFISLGARAELTGQAEELLQDLLPEKR